MGLFSDDDDKIVDLTPNPAEQQRVERDRKLQQLMGGELAHKGKPARPPKRAVVAPLPTTFDQALAVLSDDQRRFVQAFVADPTRGPSGAYIAAGLSGAKSASRGGKQLMGKPGVKEAIALGETARSTAIVEATKYDAVAFFRELDDAIAHAKKTDNSTAYVRAVELRAKCSGLLTERLAVSGSAFTLILDTSARPGSREDIDGEAQRLDTPGEVPSE